MSGNEEVTHASILFGTSDSVDDLESKSEPNSHEDLTALTEISNEKSHADTLYGSPEAAVGMLGSSLKESAEAIGDKHGMAQAEIEKMKENTSHLLLNLDYNPAETRKFYGLYASTVIDAPSKEQIDEWSAETMQNLRRQYGNEVDQKITLVREFVDAHPPLKQALSVTGLGSHPEVVADMIRRAESLLVKGKWKRKS